MSPAVSLGSLITGCMLIIQYCYIDKYIRHKTNRTLQACNILSDCIML